ncbi:MAG: N-acetylmuramoyl-L-alanine amidase [Anaerolineae bacterium]|nr:N-acetylmuramoyl-L-alanine amidase [Anaerolineae bacterium]
MARQKSSHASAAKSRHASTAYEESIGAAPNASRLVVIISCMAAIGAMVYGMWGPRLPVMLAPEATPLLALSATPPANPLPFTAPSATPLADPLLSAAPSATPPANPLPFAAPSATPSAGQSAATPHVGIVAGHWENDKGAMCPDGLTEVEINLDVAQRVVYTLRALGYQTDLLAEYDPRLEDYRADALVSIHADSCVAYPNATPPASGFKVASVEDSLVPEAESRLVACLAQCYAARTGMYFHANSITYDMIYYHSFYEINDQTPGAIIETGFMFNDRHMLTQRADLVAQGIVDGIVCFIEDERP